MTAEAKKAAAERQRRARARRRASVMVAPVEIDVELSERLIELGLLHPWHDDDRHAVGQALGELLRRHLLAVTRDSE